MKGWVYVVLLVLLVGGVVVAERDPRHAGLDERHGALADRLGVQLGTARGEPVGDEHEDEDEPVAAESEDIEAQA